ncbi:MAG: hypothetical protein O7E52_26465 [Candidatus Poribacteria bacterium]|nr:hypothetical protein [Candidatus Poribacteria bacterium]
MEFIPRPMPLGGWRRSPVKLPDPSLRSRTGSEDRGIYRLTPHGKILNLMPMGMPHSIPSLNRRYCSKGIIKSQGKTGKHPQLQRVVLIATGLSNH